MSSARYDFSGCVAIVTGGARGIGSVIARAFARAGASCSIWDLSRSADPAEGMTFDEVDVTRPDSIQAAVEHALARHGRIDMLVNSAGFAGATVPLDEYDPAEWQRIIDVNLVGTYQVCRHVVPVMRRQASGRIVNIASLAGKEGTSNASAYSAAKAGVIALTKSLGKELAHCGVLVNGVAPAAVDTPLLAQMSEAHVRTMISKSPMGRLGTPQEVAELVLWLSSASCSFSTGAIFDLSGGRATY